MNIKFPLDPLNYSTELDKTSFDITLGELDTLHFTQESCPGVVHLTEDTDLKQFNCISQQLSRLLAAGKFLF